MYYKGFERTILVLSEDIVQRNRENLYKANREKSSFDSVFKFYSPPPPLKEFYELEEENI